MAGEYFKRKYGKDPREFNSTDDVNKFVEEKERKNIDWLTVISFTLATVAMIIAIVWRKGLFLED